MFCTRSNQSWLQLMRYVVGLMLLAVVAAVGIPRAAAQQSDGYSIQVMAATDSASASREVLRINQFVESRFRVYVEVAAPYHRVRLGDFTTLDVAQTVLREVRTLGYPDAFVVRPAARKNGIAPLLGTPVARGDTLSRVATLSEPPSGPPSASLPMPAPNPRTVARRQVQAIRIVGGAVRMDGKLDDSAWAQARFSSDFLVKGEDRGYPTSERTEVAFLYDDEALYVGARMSSSSPADVQRLISRRDNPGTAERVLVSLDTYLDRRTAYTFGVTAGGVRIDHYHPQDNEWRTDASFDPVWEARTAADSTGWTAEMRIPFSQLRFRQRGAQVWGINVNRSKPGRDRNDYWVVVPMNEAGWASRFGELTGLEVGTSSRRVEILPYVAAGGTFKPAQSGGSSNDLNARVGGDLKLGLAPNLTLDATINPDFGQVEADPAQVNLSAFETFFPERRPFFVEGGHLLQGSGPTYFYSRRIGAIPPGTSSNRYIDQPLNSTIPVAVKLTGRLNSGLSMGALAALTSREQAGVADPATGVLSSVDVAPLSGFGVARLQQDFGPSGSWAGLMFTGVQRDLPPGSLLARILNRQAVAGSGDWNLRFSEGKYELSGHAGFSHVSGDSAAILRAQYSSARYFQRPDAPYVSLDPSRTSLSGYTGALGIAKNTGEHWLWETRVFATSPGFEINDAGAMSLADRIEAFANLRYRGNRPQGLLRGYEVALFTNSGWNFGGVRQYTAPSLYVHATWKNLLSSYAQVGVDTRALSDKLTRGGPLAGTANGWSTRVGVSTDFAARTRWSANGYYYGDEFGGWSYTLHGGLSMRPSPRWEFSVDPGYARANNAWQFFTVLPGGRSATFGNRYVFSSLERNDIYTKVRLNYALNPDVTLELFAMPFVSSGHFYGFGELWAPRSRLLRLYGTDGTTITPETDRSRTVIDGENRFTLYNADYNLRSFRSNAVLRWEWRRGSTLFLIWQQNGFAYEPQGDPVRTTALWNALGDRVNNILALKLTYWLPMN